MKFSIITPNLNGGRFLADCLHSVASQSEDGVDVEHIILDGGSTDDSLDIIQLQRMPFQRVICEPDGGPAAAINRGLTLARGDVVAWLNSDDRYHPGALARVAKAMDAVPGRGMYFGRCRIINEKGREIRQTITRFKELFFPVASLFVLQCLNFVSQPAIFFRKNILLNTGSLRTDLHAAWDYDLWLRLWEYGNGCYIEGPYLADYRWHLNSISGKHYVKQFREEFSVAVNSCGSNTPQAWIHYFMYMGIVGIYSLIAARHRL
jgi:glycosyltransferase involved in cell wall biosynthesis